MAVPESTISDEQKACLIQLEAPFDPSEIKWRVTHTSRDGKKGAVIPFADPRAYTDRLNQLFTPTGWTRAYEIATLSSLSRVKKDKMIQTGKILVTCVVTIHRLGSHSGSGEEWADEENAMTSAEAQAFKRACSCFGLGRYFYSFAEMWVPLDEYREPLSLPTLPKWALPTELGRPDKLGADASGTEGGDTPSSLHQNFANKIESFRPILGESIYSEILKRAGNARSAQTVQNATLQASVAMWMERAARGIRRTHTLAEAVGDERFHRLLDNLEIKSISTIQNLGMLKTLVSKLEAIAHPQAA